MAHLQLWVVRDVYGARTEFCESIGFTQRLSGNSTGHINLPLLFPALRYVCVGVRARALFVFFTVHLKYFYFLCFETFRLLVSAVSAS